MIPLAQPF